DLTSRSVSNDKDRVAGGLILEGAFDDLVGFWVPQTEGAAVACDENAAIAQFHRSWFGDGVDDGRATGFEPEGFAVRRAIHGPVVAHADGATARGSRLAQ